MLSSVSENLVRFAGLMSAITFFTGYSSGITILIILEAVMTGVWLQMDYRNIKMLISKNKE